MVSLECRRNQTPSRSRNAPDNRRQPHRRNEQSLIDPRTIVPNIQALLNLPSIATAKPEVFPRIRYSPPDICCHIDKSISYAL